MNTTVDDPSKSKEYTFSLTLSYRRSGLPTPVTHFIVFTVVARLGLRERKRMIDYFTNTSFVQLTYVLIHLFSRLIRNDPRTCDRGEDGILRKRV